MTRLREPTVLMRGSDFLRIDGPSDGKRGAHALATLDVRFHDRRDRAERAKSTVGAGIYACFLDGRLFYIGIFAGTRTTRSGDVARERWRKHVAGMSLRGHRVSLCVSAIGAIGRHPTPHPIVEAVRGADPQALSRHRGLQATLNKARFAMAHWDVMESLDDDALARFQFCHMRPRAGGAWAACPSPI